MNKLELDIYDFDKTIVPFDSGTLFVAYCMVHYPWCLITLPIVAVAGLLMLLNIITFTQFKKTCFMFFPLIPKKRAVKKFWDKYESKVHTWFKDKNRFSVVISASPDFLLSEIAQRLSFDKLICTRHNYKNGMIIGENCRDEEKVRRFFEEFDKNEVTVVDVYSDSIKHDRPIFSLAENQCYHIVDSEKIPFKYSDVYK
jgi:hypothetical protein